MYQVSVILREQDVKLSIALLSALEVGLFGCLVGKLCADWWPSCESKYSI